MTTPVTASIELPLTVAVRGYYRPGERMTRDDPGCEACVEDVEIEGLTCDRYEPGITSYLAGSHVTIDLLAGVNTRDPEVQKLLANIIAALGDDAHEALMDDHLRSAA